MMKKRVTGRAFVLTAAALFALTATRATAATLSLLPAGQNARPGDLVTLEIAIHGLATGGPDSLGDFDLDIGFDPGALSFVGYELGPYLGEIATLEAFDFSFGDVGGGRINLAEVSNLDEMALDVLQPAVFSLATLEFRVDVLSVSSATTVSIAEVFALGDGLGRPLALDTTAGAVLRHPAAAVPEPSSRGLVIFGLGLPYLLGCWRRARTRIPRSPG